MQTFYCRRARVLEMGGGVNSAQRRYGRRHLHFIASLTSLPELALARCSAFGGSRLPVALRMNAEIVPRGLRQVDAIMLGSLFDVRECQRAIGIGDVYDLIEPCHGVTHLPRIRQWLFPLVRKGIHGIGQVALFCKQPVFLVMFPGGLYWGLLIGEFRCGHFWPTPLF